MFAEVAATQPAFAEYLNHVYNEETVLSPDGTTKHLAYSLALKEVLSPSDASNASTTSLTIEYLQVQCRAALVKMHDERTVLPQYLASQDGELSFSKQTQAHADTAGCEASNDKFSESVFGVFDRMLKRCSGICREAASGLAQARSLDAPLDSLDAPVCVTVVYSCTFTDPFTCMCTYMFHRRCETRASTRATPCSVAKRRTRRRREWGHITHSPSQSVCRWSNTPA